jgi:flavin-dependent dehydrogenase
MREGGSNSWNVLVGGAGIAASAACIRLCALGLRPLVLSASRPLVRGIEAIPEAALPLFSELGMKRVLEEAQAAAVEGFENHWRGEERAVRKGRWIHVERTRLAMAAMHEAVRRGATVWTCHSLPALIHEPGAVGIVYQGAQLCFDAAIDATGRSAVWSRPVCRHGQQVADLYAFPAGRSARGRVVRLQESWGYRLGLGDSTTAAIIAADGKHRGKPDVHSRRLLGLRSSSSEYLGRRPAFPQWTENPIRGRRLAVGDAVLAYDPVAGQGIRFALSSAVAAVAVINTLKNSPGEGAAAERFYGTFIIQARQKHLQFVRQLWQTESRRPEPVSMPAFVVFRGQTTPAELQIGSRIVTDEAVQLDDGACVRWVGGVDLLKVRDLAREPISSSELAQRLSSKDMGAQQAAALLAWCVRQGLVTSSSAAEPPGTEEICTSMRTEDKE